MASHVVVIRDTAHPTTVKTLPSTYLKSIRDQACEKFKLAPDQYTLKRNGKELDLGLKLQFAGLAPGAKLDLVLRSRSATSVKVSVEFRDSNKKGWDLEQSFRTDTSLWRVLRAFESMPAGSAAAIEERGIQPKTLINKETFNFTQRAVPDGTTSGSGRLHYEEPVLDFGMGTQVAGVSAMQQTLGQLGVSSKLRLKLLFRDSGKPLEEAMAEISQYFKDVEEETPAAAATARSQSGNVTQQLANIEVPDVKPELPPTEPMEDVVQTAPSSLPSQSDTVASAPPVLANVQPTASHSQSTVTVYAPSSSSAPQAASIPYNESDYELNVDQAKRYQAQISSRTKNTRLLSDAEEEAKEKAQEQKNNAVTALVLRIRLPDQSQIRRNQDFEPEAPVHEVFTFVRDVLQYPDQPFHLKFVSTDKNGRLVHVPLVEDSKKNLGQTLNFSKQTAVTFTWADSVPSSIREASKKSSLKEEFRSQAIPLDVPRPDQETAASGPSGSGNKGKEDHTDKKMAMSSAEKENKLKNLFGLGKKKR